MQNALEQPAAEIPAETAISALLTLFNRYVLHEQRAEQPPLCLKQHICQHLYSLSQREDMSDILRQTFDDLHDAWQASLNRSLSLQRGALS